MIGIFFILAVIFFSIALPALFIAINKKLYITYTITYNALVIIFLIFEWVPILVPALRSEVDNAAGYLVGVELLKVVTFVYLICIPLGYIFCLKIKRITKSSPGWHRRPIR